MADEERKDVTIGAPAADAGDEPQPDPQGPPVPPDEPEPGDDDGE